MRFLALALSACAVFLTVAACKRPPISVQDPETAASAFFATLEKGDPRVAYDSTAFGFQAAQTYDAFLSNAREIGLIGGQPPGWTRKQVSGSEVRLDGTLRTAQGSSLSVSLELTPEGKAWRLFSLKTGVDITDTENHFTLVGKGTGFNDVYHQPMPSQKQVDELVRHTMELFSNAVRTDDFHLFYMDLSQQWRDGRWFTGGKIPGVTELMVKRNFEGFVRQKIDLSTIAGLKPVYEHPPMINDEGLLKLDGHFNMSGYRLYFFLKYTYELPRWKLFGIDVGLTK